MLRPILVSSLLLFSVLPAPASENRISLKPAVTTVTVYADRALVTRSATLSLTRGTHRVVLEHLPSMIQDDSVRIEGTGTAAVTITGTEIKRVFLEQDGEKRVKELNDDIRGLERKAASSDARIASVSAQKKFVESIRVAWGDRISKELAAGKPTSAELSDALKFVAEGTLKAEEQTRDIETEKRGLLERIDALKRERDSVAGSHRKEAKNIEISLDVRKEGNLMLQMSGVTGQAWWEPSYDARLSDTGKNVDLTFRGMVRQQTGEDWKGVSLSLSTARPSVGGTPPELTPWRLSIARPLPPPRPAMAAPAPQRMKKAAKRDMALDDSNGGYPEAAPVMLEAQADHMIADFSSEQASSLFTIPRKVDVLSDGSRHSNIVAVEQFPVTLEFLAIPKISQHVYLKSEITNKAPYPLLPGEVNVFSGNTFTGTSRMKKVASGEKFDLSFGTDDRFSIKRDEIRQHAEAGIFGKNRMGYRYRLEAASYRKEPVSLILKEQMPLAGDEEIKVSLEEVGIKPDETKPDGTLIWKLPLAGGEKKEFSYEIRVEYPKDRNVNGL